MGRAFAACGVRRASCLYALQKFRFRSRTPVATVRPFIVDTVSRAPS
jgi:hypothetical protein